MLLNRRQYESCNVPYPSSITKILTRYISRKLSPSPRNTSHDHPESSGPLLLPLPPRQPTELTLTKTFTTHLPPFIPQTALTTHIHALATLHPCTLYLGHTTFSHPSTPTLYGRRQHKHLPSHSHSHSHTTTTYTYLGRICHLSPTTSRLSVTLHPDDIDAVIQAGWGQRTNAPDETLLRAPINEHDLTILKKILDAAIGYVCSTGEVEVEKGNDEILWEESEVLRRPEWLLPRYPL
jgi:hypothetical protein